jgi:acetyl esterase/lipase
MDEIETMDLPPVPLWPSGQVPGALGDGEPDVPLMRPYLVGGGIPRGAMVVCPGGGYAGLAPHEGTPVARWLNRIGVSAFVLRYRVAPYRHPWPLADAQRAIRLIRHRAAEWGIDPGRVGILGFSAGGHLAGMAATGWDQGDPTAPDPVERHGCRPDLAVLCYPVLTMSAACRHEGSMRNLLGPDAPEALRREASVELRATAQTPPIFMWHTADDAGVPVENCLLLAAALARRKVPFALHVYERGRHGLGLAEDDPDVGSWTERCAAWLRAHGFGA